MLKTLPADPWLRLAEEAEAGGGNVAAAPKAPAHVVPQLQQQQAQRLEGSGETE